MPEGPEAAYITKFMNNEFINKTLNKVDILITDHQHIIIHLLAHYHLSYCM